MKKKNLIVEGADILNAFAEAAAPEQPYYTLLDDIFQDWWVSHKQCEPFPNGWVMEDHHTFQGLQGHPEADCSWERHIENYYRNNTSHQTHMNLAYTMPPKTTHTSFPPAS